MDNNYFPYSIGILFEQINHLNKIEDPNERALVIKKIDEKIQNLSQKLLEPEVLSPHQLESCEKIIEKHQTTLSSSPSEIKEKIGVLSAEIQKKADLSAPETAMLHEAEKEGTAPPHLDLYFGCDLAVPDANGAILASCLDCLEDEVPVLTSSSLLLGKNLEHTQKKEEFTERLLAIAGKKNIDVYRQNESGLLLLLPKNYPFSKETLGINFENLELLPSLFPLLTDKDESVTSPTISDIKKVFDEKSLTPKRIVLGGHGGENYIGAMEFGEYQKFVSLLNDLHTEFLDVCSCYAGGANTLQQLALEEKNNTLSKAKFPIAVESLGSFATNKVSGAAFFSALEGALKSYPSVSNPKFQQLHQPLTKTNNAAQIQFPHTGIEYGFRYIKNKNEIAALTVTEIQKQTITQKNKKGANDSSVVIPLNKKVAIISPLHVSAEIAVTTRTAPLLQTAVPGNCHILIDKLSMPSMSLLNFFTSQAKIYQDSDSQETKAFFIGQVTMERNVQLDKVVMKLDGQNPQCFYREVASGKYCCIYYDSAKKRFMVEESLLEPYFNFKIALICRETKPSDEALKTVIGASGEEASFEKEVYQAFWKGSTPQALTAYNSYHALDANEKCKSQVIDKLIASIDPKYRQGLLLAAFSNNELALAEKLISFPGLNLNIKTNDGTPILNIAVKAKAYRIVKQLLEKKTDLNAQDSKGCTSLMEALQTGGEMLALFLPYKEEINKGIMDKNGRSLLFYANTEESRNFLIEKIGINIVPFASVELLYACKKKNSEEVKKLLALGADPKLVPNALLLAVKNRDKAVTALLLDKVAGSDSAVLIKAAAHSTPEIVQLLIAKEKWKERDLQMALEKAIASGQLQNMAVLRGAGASMTIELMMGCLEKFPDSMRADFFLFIASQPCSEKLTSLMISYASLFFSEEESKKVCQLLKVDIEKLRSSSHFVEDAAAKVLEGAVGSGLPSVQLFIKILRSGALKDPEKFLEKTPLTIAVAELLECINEKNSAPELKELAFWKLLLHKNNLFIQNIPYNSNFAFILETLSQRNDSALLELFVEKFYSSHQELIVEADKRKLLNSFFIHNTMGIDFWKKIISNYPHLIDQKLLTNFLNFDYEELVDFYSKNVDKKNQLSDDESLLSDEDNLLSDDEFFQVD